MSSRRSFVVLSPIAETDFEDILVYTRGQWGAKQADTYATAIRAALREIAAYPEIGRPRDDLRVGLRSFLVQQHHFILYRIDGETIRVLRIVHVRTDPTRWLQRV
jgi:toxin ParE1/3/4